MKSALISLGLLMSFTFVTVPLVKAQRLASLETLFSIEEENAKVFDEISYLVGRQKEHRFYLNRAWQNSIIITHEGEALYFSGRFNILSRAIEFYSRNQQRVIFPNKIKIAKIGQNIIVPIDNQDFMKKEENKFFEVLSSGSYYLLNTYDLGTQINRGTSISVNPGDDESFFITETIYYTRDFKEIHKLKKSKKKILELFGKQQSKVEAFVDRFHLKVNDKLALASIFDYYNSLEKEEAEKKAH